jgi:hypothetical protein
LIGVLGNEFGERKWSFGGGAMEREAGPKEEEEGIFITPSPELAVGGSLRPGRVTRHGWPGHPPPYRTNPGRPATRAS